MSSSKLQNSRIEWLDSLRGIAVLIIFAAHVMARYPGTVNYSHGVGKIGVWFFMLSAGWLLLRAAPERMNRRWVAAYYIGKFLRLFPCLVIGALLTYQADIIKTPKLFLQTIFFWKGPAHIWYVPVLAVFYLIAPLILLLNQKAGSRAVTAVLALAFGLLFGFCFPFTKYPENSTALKWYLPVFLMGILLAAVPEPEKKRAGWDGAACVFALGIFALTPAVTCGIFGSNNYYFLPNKYLLIGGLWFGILFSVMRGRVLAELLGKMKPLIWLAKVSYPFYLIHYPLIILIKRRWNIGGWEMMLLAFFASLAASVLVYVLIERPVGKLTGKIKKAVSGEK